MAGMNVGLGSLELADMVVEMRLEYRLGRRIEQGSDGDDMILEGRKSYEFVLSGKLSMEQLRAIEKEVARGEPIFRSEFGEFKVAVKSVHYRSDTGEVSIVLVEDVC
ncbi:MAG: hypothetical protein FJ149_04230 [Euryarchaeota archaeon]|nr:hypothetical protein [Euryarchaeota archaeon]